jgi:hypothetical protein
MMRKSRIGLAAVLTTTGFGFICLAGTSEANYGDDLGKTVKKIAAEIKKGNEASAKKMAKAAVLKIDELSEIMHLYRPTDKEGLGIENELKKPTAKDGAELGNLVRAMAAVTAAKGWEEDMGKRNPKAWAQFTSKMDDAAKNLAKAKSAKEVTEAATKVLDSCDACHKVFKN